MLKEIITRVRQGFRTSTYPAVEPTLPPRFRGRPAFEGGACETGCDACAASCPTSAVRLAGGVPGIDLGKCLFCAVCAESCPEGRIRFTSEYRLAAARRDDLLLRAGGPQQIAPALHATAQRLFGRSLRLRQVSAGGCNACEADVNVLGTVGFDIGQFGIEFVASPRHADGLLVTGPVSRNMLVGLKKTWDAVPDPKIVIAVGACAVSGGPYAGNPEVHDGVSGIIPVDLFVPGCPPHPMTVLDGILRMLGRIESSRPARSESNVARDGRPPM